MPIPDDFDPAELTASQLRAARALLNWRAQDLADKADVGVATVRRAELCEGVVTTHLSNVEKMVQALQKAGVVFIPAVGGGVGVRMKR